MKRNILFRTNLFVCAVIVLGFIVTSITSYHSNRGIFERDVERVSALTSEGIYHQIDSIFTKPINISLTMANDSLLKEFLSDEQQRLDDAAFIDAMRNYLLAYQAKYSYDSVFLVSSQTNRYYHFNGLDRILTPENPENEWYYSLLQSHDEYSLKIDNDEAAAGEITIFINCKIKDATGSIMGIVGVGFRVGSLQDLLRTYETKFDVEAYLINGDGTIEISTNQTGYQSIDLFENCNYPALKEEIFSERENAKNFWYSYQGGKGYLVTKYVPNLDWYLIIDNDTTALNRQLRQQLIAGIIVVIAVLAFVLLLITNIIQKYNAQIVKLTVAKEQEHRSLFQEVTEQLYEDIYELDITHNCVASESTEAHFEQLGVPKNTPFDQALQIIAQNQIKEEYRQGYIDTFSPKHVLQAYQNGTDTLCYDFMITNDGQTYYWMRITAQIFAWEEDKSIRMFTYRQNIDEQKRHERYLLEKMQKDSLSGLLNKAATQEYIHRLLLLEPEKLHAFFILDIDEFKHINDSYGHAAGDSVIADFAKMVKAQFQDNDIVGRIGGDEFVVFVSIPSREWAAQKAQNLLLALRQNQFGICKVSASIGVAIAPESGVDFETLYRNADTALYCTKEKGRDGFTVYSPH